MWSGSISLPVKKTVTQDDEGFQTETWEYLKNVCADFRDATRSDETLGNQGGYSASLVARIKKCNYNQASFFIDEDTGKVYDIRRTYHPDKSMDIELTGEVREGGKV